MVKKLAKRVLTIERSLFYAIKEMASKYRDAIYLSVGEPDFTTPIHIIDSAKKALDQGFTHYTGDKGMFELRQLIAEKLGEEKGIDVDPNEEVIITIGAAAANCATIMATVDPGDEVIIASPYYPPYNMVTRMAGGIPKLMRLREEGGFTPDQDGVEKLVTKRTKLIIINSPNNPTGAVFDKDCLEALAEIAKKHDLFVLSDEVYEKLTYGDTRHHSIASLPDMFERTVITGSFSKEYAMTGWRVGYAAGPRRLISHMVKINYAMNVSAPSMAQKAAVTALTSSQDCVKDMVEEYDKRRKIVVKGLNEIPGVQCVMPRGAFYAFPNIKKIGMPSLDFAKYLVKEARVATVPGTAFGPDGEGHLRISYASSIENVKEALRRMREAVEKLSPQR